MASTTSASGNGRLPWYRRLFGGRSATPSVAVHAVPPRPRTLYVCRDCRFESNLRGVVYDHIKSFHKDVLDRHGHIEEAAQSMQ